MSPPHHRLDFTFMGLAYIIVYCGAIAIIFLFVIMMISTSKVHRRLTIRTSTSILLLLTITTTLFVFEPLYEITYSFPLLALIPFTLTDLFQSSLLLYIAYPMALLIVAVALLLVLLGLIHLVLR
jgi:NADH:ubiquinone oxidoreductase subunit 6 (subunit J)